jgi:hypothetical protein
MLSASACVVLFRSSAHVHISAPTRSAYNSNLARCGVCYEVRSSHYAKARKVSERTLSVQSNDARLTDSPDITQARELWGMGSGESRSWGIR